LDEKSFATPARCALCGCTQPLVVPNPQPAFEPAAGRDERQFASRQSFYELMTRHDCIDIVKLLLQPLIGFLQLVNLLVSAGDSTAQSGWPDCAKKLT